MFSYNILSQLFGFKKTRDMNKSKNIMVTKNKQIYKWKR